MKFPGSFLNVLHMQKIAEETVSSEQASTLRTAFTEAQTNIYMLNELKSKQTSKMRRLYGPEKNNSFERIIYGLYQEVSGQDFGMDLSPNEKDVVSKLKRIDYTNEKKEEDNLRTFVQILKEYNPPKQDNNDNHKCGTEMFSENQIREGLKQFAKECENPEQFETIVEHILTEKSKENEIKRNSGNTIAGVSQSTTELAHNFYSALAEDFRVPIRKKPIEKNGSLYPHSHSAFSLGDSIKDIDPFSSPGILPGITKKWVRKENEVYGSEEGIPANLMIIDNSPSMFENESPNIKCYPHILGATAITNAYLKNGSRVAVYSFGSNDYLTDFSDNRKKIHTELRRYSNSGGTTFNAGLLEKIVKRSNIPVDVTVISDMEISNLEGFIDSIRSLPQTHRIHLIYTSTNHAVAELKKEFGSRNNIAIIPLATKNDIPKITIGELKKSMH
jgi:hypothetical protein